MIIAVEMGVIFLLKCKTENYQYISYTIRPFQEYYTELKSKLNRKTLRQKGKPTLLDYIYENGGINNWEYEILFDEATGSKDELKRKVQEYKKTHTINI